jgi:hypothetical protein
VTVGEQLKNPEVCTIQIFILNDVQKVPAGIFRSKLEGTKRAEDELTGHAAKRCASSHRINKAS